jgi:hypothetical protein
MRKILFLAALTSLIQISCKKDASTGSTPTSLDGRWRMVIVKDNASGLITTKPGSVERDIDITFAYTTPNEGVFNGSTPANLISQSLYSTGSNQSIHIDLFMATKVNEPEWGNLFIDNFGEAQSYSFATDGLLNIKTINKILTLKKL